MPCSPSFNPAAAPQNPTPALNRIITIFETLSPERLPELQALYTTTAWFKDPFNEVRGAAAIARIFTHMFQQVDHPRFTVQRSVAQGHEAFLIWDFHFALRRPLPTRPRRIHGCSHLCLDDQGNITTHRDYWDTSEELYAQLPLIGPVMRALRRRSAAPQDLCPPTYS
jgi:steroid delta-isomerase